LFEQTSVQTLAAVTGFWSFWSLARLFVGMDSGNLLLFLLMFVATIF